MEQYISKTVIMAKIEEWRERIKKGILSIPLRGKDRASAAFEYEILGKVKDFLDTFEIKEMRDNSLEKFKSLQHITKDLYKTLADWGYSPNLYFFDRMWHVSWISCEEGDSIKDFEGSTPEEAIDKAYIWFHSKFCND